MLTLLARDLRLQFRRGELLASSFVMGVLMLLAFNFSLDLSPDNVAALAPGILWVAVLFSAGLAAGHGFVGERENGCMDAIVASPLDRGSVYLAKFIVNLLLLLLFETMLLPVFALFFELTVLPVLAPLALVLLLGSIGLAAVGTLFALVTVSGGGRDLALPILLLPLEVPLLIASVKITRVVMAGGDFPWADDWVRLLLGFDLLFVVAGWLAFEYVATD
ncbi:MAG: heme exporter protein CcmB [Proteobacteria bacterium]|nr:heme exporter protein CcmB [Pseudomonadota bacterium]